MEPGDEDEAPLRDEVGHSAQSATIQSSATAGSPRVMGTSANERMHVKAMQEHSFIQKRERGGTRSSLQRELSGASSAQVRTGG